MRRPGARRGGRPSLPVVEENCPANHGWTQAGIAPKRPPLTLSAFRRQQRRQRRRSATNGLQQHLDGLTHQIDGLSELQVARGLTDQEQHQLFGLLAQTRLLRQRQLERQLQRQLERQLQRLLDDMNELSERLQARGLTEEERQALQSQIVAKADEMRLLRQQLARGRAGSSSGSARRSSDGGNGGSEGGSDGDDGGGGSGSGKGGGGSGGAAREANAAIGGSSEEGNLSEADGDSDAAMPSSSEQKRGSKEWDGRAVAGGEGSDGEGSHNIEAAMRSSSEEGEGVAAMAGGEGSDGEGGHGGSDGGSSVHTGEVQQMLFVGDDVDQEGAADDLAQQVAELGPVHMAQQQQQPVETPAGPGDKAAPMPTPLAAQPSCHHAHTSGKPATQLAFTYVARLAGAGARTSCCPLQPQCA